MPLPTQKYQENFELTKIPPLSWHNFYKTVKYFILKNRTEKNNKNNDVARKPIVGIKKLTNYSMRVLKKSKNCLETLINSLFRTFLVVPDSSVIDPRSQISC